MSKGTSDEPNAFERLGRSMQSAGDATSKAGGKLFFLFTVPIILAILFGPIGLIIGVIIAALVLKGK